MSIRISLAIKALLVVFTPYIGVSTPFQAHLFRLVTENAPKCTFSEKFLYIAGALRDNESINKD